MSLLERNFSWRTARPMPRTARPLAVLLGLLCVGVLAGAPASASRQADRTLRIGILQDISSLNPATSGQTAAAIYVLAYEPLVHMNLRGQLQPGLAISWRFRDLGRGPNKDFELTLRRNARFSDGTPVTAPAVTKWLRYFATAGGGFTSQLGPNPSFTSLGKWKLRIRLTVPTPTLPIILSEGGQNWGFVASSQAVDDPSALATRTDGAGPYVLDRANSVRGDHYTYVPNRFYYNKKAIRFKSVYLKVIPTASSILQALQAKQLDAATGDITTAKAAEAAGFGVAWGTTQQTLLHLNPKLTPALSDVRVRQAMNYAIDRKTIARALLGKYGAGTSEFITSDADPGLQNYYPYNPAKARSLLAAAGHSGGLKIAALDYTFAGVLGDPVVQAAAKYLDDVGIHLDISSSATGGDWVAKAPTYPVFQNGVTINITPSRYALMLSPASRYVVYGNDATVHRLYYGGLKDANPYVKWKQMWRRVTTQAYYVPLVTGPSMMFYSKSIGGVAISKARFGVPLPTEWFPK